MDFETISAWELDQYMEKEGVVLVDVRPEQEYRKKRIRGAVSFPYEPGNNRFPFSKDMTYILYCARGSVSLAAARKMAEQGYRVKTVIGGIRAYQGCCLDTSSS